MTERPSPEDVLRNIAAVPAAFRASEYLIESRVVVGALTAAGYSIVTTDEWEALRRLRDAAVAWRATPLAPLADLIDGINPRGDALDALAAVIDALGELGEHGEAQR